MKSLSYYQITKQADRALSFLKASTHIWSAKELDKALGIFLMWFLLTDVLSAEAKRNFDNDYKRLKSLIVSFK